MASPETTAPAQPAPLDERTCSKCKTRKQVSPETWVYRRNDSGRYAAEGTICLACRNVQKAEYKNKTKRIAKMIGADVTDENKRKDIVTAAKMDVARALKAGGKVLNEYAPAVLAKIIGWFEDDTSPRHEWAVQFLAERILPRKLYEELGGQAAGVGAIGDKRPQFVIQVLPAAQPAPVGNIIDGVGHVVEVLPASTNKPTSTE